jgi:ABC-type sugar transport system permease subunit
MGTILFLVLRLAFGYNAPGDAQAISIIVSLDSIAAVLFFKLKRNKPEKL